MLESGSDWLALDVTNQCVEVVSNNTGILAEVSC